MGSFCTIGGAGTPKLLDVFSGSVSANTDTFTDDIVISNDGYLSFEIITISATAIISEVINGTATKLNGGTSISAGTKYVFENFARNRDKINFRSDTAADLIVRVWFRRGA